MGTTDVDKEVIARYVKDFIGHGDPAEVASYLLAEARHDQDAVLALLEHATISIRNQAQRHTRASLVFRFPIAII